MFSAWVNSQLSKHSVVQKYAIRVYKNLMRSKFTGDRKTWLCKWDKIVITIAEVQSVNCKRIVIMNESKYTTTHEFIASYRSNHKNSVLQMLHPKIHSRFSVNNKQDEELWVDCMDAGSSVNRSQPEMRKTADGGGVSLFSWGLCTCSLYIFKMC